MQNSHKFMNIMNTDISIERVSPCVIPPEIPISSVDSRDASLRLYSRLSTQRPSIRMLRDSLVRTQILSRTMSGWNDGGRGERGNRRMFDPAEVSVGDEEVLDVGRAFNPGTRMQQQDEEGEQAYFGRRGREIQTSSLLSCLTS